MRYGTTHVPFGYLKTRLSISSISASTDCWGLMRKIWDNNKTTGEELKVLWSFFSPTHTRSDLVDEALSFLLFIMRVCKSIQIISSSVCKDHEDGTNISRPYKENTNK